MSERCVMIVDDEASIRESLAEFLRDFDMTVETAENGEEALEILTRNHIQVLVADLRLPGMTGDIMIPKAHRLQPKIRFLIHTGSIDYQLSKELLTLDIFPEHVLLKPLSDLMVLVDKIEALFEKQT